MTKTNDASDPLTDRVLKVEIEVRRIKRLGMGAALIVGLMLGFLMPGRGGLNARRIALADKTGKARMTVESVGDDGAEVTVHDPAGNPVKATLRARDGKIELVPAVP